MFIDLRRLNVLPWFSIALQTLVILMTCRLLPWMSGWLVGAMGLGKDPVLGRPTNLDYSRGARAYCACSRCGWGLVWTFFSRLSVLSSFSLHLGDGPIWTETLSQRAVTPKTTQPTNQHWMRNERTFSRRVISFL